MKIRALLGIGLALALPGAASADLNISKKATLNMSCTGGVCTATAKNAVLNVGDLTAMLASGDLTVKTGGGAVAIQVNESFSWTSTNRLTLDANESIGVHKPIVVAGTGALTITTNDGGTDGDLKFFDSGRIDFWDTNSSLVINGGSYALVGDIKKLAKDIAANPSGLFALAESYDAGPHGRYPKSPVRTAFSGTFDGLGHEIENLAIYAQGGVCLGLFQQINGDGTVRDIALANADLSDNGDSQRYNQMGALAGCNYGTILSAHANGTVSVYRGYAGGLVGGNFGGQVSLSSADVAVAGPGAGGLVGRNGGQVVRSHATGPVEGAYAGGLVAANGSDHYGYPGEILLSHAEGSVTTGGIGGGLAGLNNAVSKIEESFATGAVDGNEACLGGLVGCSVSKKSGSGSVSNSYATGAIGSVGGAAIVGGLEGGDARGAVATSYSIGAVGTALYDVGGFVGSDRGRDNFSYDYWDLDTSGGAKGCGRGKCTGATGLTDVQLKSALPTGFDPAVWGQSAGINHGYPYLLANPPQ